MSFVEWEPRPHCIECNDFGCPWCGICGSCGYAYESCACDDAGEQVEMHACASCGEPCDYEWCSYACQESETEARRVKA